MSWQSLLLIFVLVVVSDAQDGGIASFFGKAKTSVIKSLEEKEAERQNKTNLFGKLGSKLEDQVATELDGLEGSGSGDGGRRPPCRQVPRLSNRIVIWVLPSDTETSATTPCEWMRKK